MERSRELYDRIVKEGKSAIEEFIEDRYIEELFLDFKRSSNNGTEKKLSQTDRQNLAKAISGFGNSEGGVLVWGVDCSKDTDGADVAKALVLLDNPQRFSSLLQGAISGCTIPPHPGVEHKAILINGDRGVVISYIPKSNSAPHQMLPNRHYYIRAGSDFIPTPHDVLAGMFGRRPQPSVFHCFTQITPFLEANELHIPFNLLLNNDGPGVASDLYAICTIEYLPGPNCTMSFETPDKDNWYAHFEFQRKISMITNVGFRLPPKAIIKPFNACIILIPPFEGELRITGSVGAGESHSYEFVIENSATTIEKQYNLFIEKSLRDSLSYNEKHAISSIILGNTDSRA